MAFDLLDSKTATITPGTPVVDAAGVAILNADGSDATTAQLGITVTFLSSDDTVATVDGNGVVTPTQPIVANGTCTVTITGTNPDGSAVSGGTQDFVVTAGVAASFPTTVA
jgi:hypothetical protein